MKSELTPSNPSTFEYPMPNSGLNETARPTKEATHPPDPGSGVRIRALGYADLTHVISIERRSFASPWSVGMFALEMSKPDTVSLAALEGSRIIGYLVLSRYDRAWHLMNIAVAPEHRRRGTASVLVNEALARIDEGAPVTLEVRPTNRSAIRLYASLGFRSYGLRRGYYPDNGEDALIMWKGDPEVAGVPAESFEELPAGI